MIGTFALVLVFTMFKEAYEDYQRYKSDKELNNKETRVLDYKTGGIKECLWSDIEIGEIVKVEKDEEIPADLLCISAPKDLVFISTMNLDGETNLKERVLAVDDFDKDKLMNFEGEI